MAIYFKLSEDGKEVLVAKTLFGKTMNYRDFTNKSKTIKTETFINVVPQKYKARILSAKMRLEEIEKMELTVLGGYYYPNPVTRTTTHVISVGDKVFRQQDGEEAEIQQKQEALAYLKEYYGEEFAKEHESKLSENEVFYFSGKKEMSKEEYKKIAQEREMLTSIVCLGKQNNKNDGVKK